MTQIVLRRSAAVFTVGLLALACGSAPGSAPSVPSQPGTPKALTITTTPEFGTLHLSWDAPGGALDGYELSVSLSGSAQVSTAEIPPDVIALDVRFTPDPPEGSSWSFLLRALRNGAPVESWVAQLRFGLHSPFVQLRPPVTPSGPEFYWFANSDKAAQILVERAPQVQFGDPPPETGWKPVATVPASALEWTDPNVTDDSQYAYRFWYQGAGLVSDKFFLGSVEVPPLGPTDFTALAQTGHVHLSWRNHTSTALQIFLNRILGNETVLPAGTSSYDDPVESGCALYTLVVQGRHGRATAMTAAWMPGAAGDFGIQSTVRPGAPASVLVPAGLLGWWFVDSFGGTTTFRSSGTSPLTLPALTADTVGPFQVEGTGYPVVVTRSFGQPVALFVFDGTAWQSEPLTFVDADWTRPIILRLDDAGVPHLLWTVPGTLTDPPLVKYAHRGPSGWTVEEVARRGLSTADFGPVTLAVDPSGAVHAVHVSDAVRYARRGTNGSWITEAVPIAQPERLPGRVGLAVAATGPVTLIYDQPDILARTLPFRGVIRTEGVGWSGDTLLASVDSPELPFWWDVQPTPTGSAFVIDRTLGRVDASSWSRADLGGCRTNRGALAVDMESGGLKVLEGLGQFGDMGFPWYSESTVSQ